MVRFVPNLAGNWTGAPVTQRLSQALSCPVSLLNDVRLATLGEWRFGAGRGTENMVLFALGTGVGGGVVVDGKLRLGPVGSAGEIGHQIMLPGGPRCGCGVAGCLEALVSGPALSGEGVRLLLSNQAPKLHELVAGEASRVNPKTMAEAAREGDGNVEHAIVRAGEYLGLAVANQIVTLHPEVVVIGGGVAEIGPLLLDAVRETVSRNVKVFPADDVRIEKAALGAEAGSWGALALARSGLGS